MRHRLAECLRTFAVLAVHTAQALDPQPEPERGWSCPFTVETSTGTVTGEHHWHWTG